MSQHNDILIINQTINDSGFSGDSGLFSVTLGINSNKFSIFSQNDVTNICNYKITANNNVYNDANILLSNVFNNDDLKESFIEESQLNINEAKQNISIVEENIDYLQNYFNNKSLVKEFYNIFFLNKSSKYFGKFSNYIIRNVINDNQNFSNYLEDSYFNNDQINYFDFIDYTLVNDKTKDLFLYDVRQNNVISSNFNIETFVCQNFLNLTQSLSTLSSGIVSKYLGISNDNFVSLDGNNNNICETVDSSEVNYFNYISESDFVFDGTSFSSQEVNASDIFSESYLVLGWKNLGNKVEVSSFTNKAVFNYQNILKVNSKRLSPLYSKFYRVNSSYNFENNVSSINLDSFDVLYRDAIDQIDKALKNIKDVDLNRISSLGFFEFNRYLINQSFLSESNIYNTDFTLSRDLFDDVLFSFDNNNQEFFLRNKIDAAINQNENGDDLNMTSCIALQVLNRNLSKNIGTIYINNQLSTKSILPSLPTTSRKMKGEENTVEIKNFDSDFSFCENVVDYSIKIDSLIKKIKNISLKEKNIDLSTFKQILSNIKNKRTDSKIISFSTSDLSNVQLAKNGQNLQKIISTKVDNINYSNFSLVTKENKFTSLKSLVEKIYDEVENSDVELENTKINNLIKNYYLGKYFKTSSNFLKSILKNILIESNLSDNDVLFPEKALNQYLYLNYILNPLNNKDVKEIIVKRFIEKAITKFANCSSSLKNTSRFNFDVQSLNLNDYKENIVGAEPTAFPENKKAQISSFFSDLEDTNEDYKKISNEIFSQESFEEISNQFDYKKIDNIKVTLDIQENFANKVRNRNLGKIHISDIETYSDFRNIIRETLQDTKFSISFNSLRSFLPLFYNKTKRFINEDQKTGVKAFKSEIKIERYKELLNFQDNLEIENLQKHKKISKFIYVDKSFSKSQNNREIIDIFDRIIDNDFEFKTEDYIFSKLTEVIFDLIKIVKKDISEEKFESYEDIATFIDDNKQILDLSYETIEIYARFYEYYIKKLHHETAIKFLSYDLAFADNVDVSQSEYNIFGLVPTNSTNANKQRSPKNVYNSFLQSKNHSLKTKDNLVSILSENSVETIFSDLYRIKNNLESYESIKPLKNDIDNEKSKAINQIENISTILMHSDIYQAINFDIVKLILNFYKYNISQINVNEINNLFLQIENIDTRKLSSNLFNTFYLNKMYENLNYTKMLNNLFLENMFSATSTREFFNQNNFLQILNRVENHNYESLLNSEVSNSILNGDLYNINLNLEEVSSISKENLIKVKINIIDHNRVDRIFLPKILLFSPLIFDPSEVSFLDNNLLGYYNVSYNKDKDFIYYNDRESIFENEYLNFVINNKINENSLTENVSNTTTNQEVIFSHIEDCHIKSNVINKIMHTLHNINLSDKNTIPNISQSTFNKINNMSEEKFVDLFELDKNNIEDIFSSNNDGSYTVNLNEKNYSMLKLIDGVNKITSKEFLKKLLSLKDYMNINFEIIPEDFVYFVQSKVNDQEESNIQNVTGNYTLSPIEKITCILEDIDLDYLSSNIIYKVNNSSAIDNYSIFIDIEVI